MCAAAGLLQCVNDLHIQPHAGRQRVGTRTHHQAPLSRISADDDWAAFEAKLQEVRAMAAVYGRTPVMPDGVACPVGK